ncbi:MAG TPA: sulfatase [Verrucomicrobiae bacterium]|nr:sulfatase [Verrucomicrobiae bacterium]
MKNKQLILAASLALAAGAPAIAAQPNIIVLLVDDMGYGDVGPFGSQLNPTPNLDRMAQEGMKLTSFYAAPVCSASRAQLLTGCYAPRVSMPWVLGAGDHIGLNPAELTVPEVLKSAGYSTLMIGKWHLGDQPEFLPLHYGFDHYFGFPYSNDIMLPAADSDLPVVPLMRDDQVIALMTDADQNMLTELYTDQAVHFLKERSRQKQPFFLYLAYDAVHFPIHPGVRWIGKSHNGRFGDWVVEVDWSVGRILDTLRELKLATNTLVFFTSDNGPWLVHGKDAGTAFPLRGGKGSTWEGGLREPAIAWWPGHVPAGVARDTVAGTIDFLPTFASLAMAQIPADKKIDGADISKLLLGQTTEAAREAQYYYLKWQLQAVRVGDWKLALCPQQLSMQVNTGGVSEPGLRLYNLAADIGEKNDVAAAHPDIVKRLKALADRQQETLCNNSSTGPGVRPPGWVAHPQYLVPVKPSYRPPSWPEANYRQLFPNLSGH